MAERLSLIAGSGALVPEVIAGARQRGFEIQVLSLQGRRAIDGLPAVRFDLGNPEPAFAEIRRFGATLATMAGGVHLSDSNREGLVRLMNAGTSSVGDTVLSALAGQLAKLTGARVVGVHEIVPALLAPEGHIGGPAANAALLETAAFAIGLARRAGSLDVGQGVVVSGRRAIAIEDIAGTDALLKRVGTYRRLGMAADGASPLVFAKAAKPDQPHSIDLPAIGPKTIANARKAGVVLIAVQAGATLLIERQKLAAAAAAARIPVLGIMAQDG